MMQMLEAGGMQVLVDDTRSPDEDNPRGYYEYEPVKRLRDDSSCLAEAQGKAVKIIYALLYSLPPDLCYKVIFMERDLGEVIASQNRMLDRRGKTRGSLPVRELSSAMKRQVHEVDAWMSGRDYFEVLRVEHAQVIGAPGPTAQRVVDFLNCGLDIDAMQKVVDRSLHRQRS